MATAQVNAAASLDQFLVDVGAGPSRCWLPGRPGVEFIASLIDRERPVGLAGLERDDHPVEQAG